MVPTELSTHVLSTPPTLSHPPSCSLNVVIPLRLLFFWLSCAWCNLLPHSSYCCIPAHLHFVIPLFQLSITSLCLFLHSTLILLTFCCFHILPTLIMLLHSNVVLWSSNSRYGNLWPGMCDDALLAPGCYSSPAACDSMDQLSKHEGTYEATGQLLPTQPRVNHGDTNKVYTISSWFLNLFHTSEKLSCNSLGYVMALVYSLVQLD